LKLYISHVSEEALFALLLKDFIESTFLGQVEATLTCGSGDSAADKKWLQGIDGALDSAKLLLLLCSPRSIQHGWIHFQAGCAWMKNLPVLAICHSGLKSDALPPPLSVFEDPLDVRDRDFMEKLLTALAGSVGIHRLPRLSYETMMAELRATLASIAPQEEAEKDLAELEDEPTEKAKPEPRQRPAKAPEPAEEEPEPVRKRAPERKTPEAPKLSAAPEPTASEWAPEKPAAKPVAPRTPLSSLISLVTKEKGKKAEKVKEKAAAKTEAPEVKAESLQKRILRLLSESDPRGYTLDDLSDILEVMAPKLEPYLDALKEQSYIDVSISVNSPAEYSLAPKGRKYLSESKVS
jgi:DNA-binding PadR family transcriptional regulator